MEISQISGMCHTMLFPIPYKSPVILALACSLLTRVLSIAKNNICFLNDFLAIFTETWKEMATIFKRAQHHSKKRRQHE